MSNKLNNKKPKSTIKKQQIEGRNSFPDPIKAKCFQCSQEFWIKFVIPQQNYSKKNDWEYWSGETGKGKICNQCLKALYYEKSIYRKVIKDLNKRKTLANYISYNFV